MNTISSFSHQIPINVSNSISRLRIAEPYLESAIQLLLACNSTRYLKRKPWRTITIIGQNNLPIQVRINLIRNKRSLCLLGFQPSDIKLSIQQGTLHEDVRAKQLQQLLDVLSNDLKTLFHDTESRKKWIPLLSQWVMRKEVSQQELNDFKHLSLMSPGCIKTEEDLTNLKDSIVFARQHCIDLQRCEVQFLVNFTKLTEEQIIAIIKFEQLSHCGYGRALEIFRNHEASSQPLMALRDLYIQQFALSLLTAFSAIEILRAKYSTDKIERLLYLIKKNYNVWEEDATLANQPKLIRKDSATPCSLQCSANKTFFFLLNAPIGSGSYKRVKLSLNAKTGYLVARITEKWTTHAHRTRIELEFQIGLNAKLANQQGIAHNEKDSLIAFKSHKSPFHKIGYMQQRFNGGDLENAFNPQVKTHPLLISEEKWLIAYRILQGLQWLHLTEKIIHRDIKPANILLMRTQLTHRVFDAALCDFGLSCNIDSTRERRKIQGTLIYVAPEIMKTRTIHELFENTTFSIDMWSTGLTLFELFKENVPEWATHSHPWLSETTVPECEKAIASIGNDWLKKPKDPHSIGSLIWSLLRPNPKERLTITSALSLFKELTHHNKMGYLHK